MIDESLPMDYEAEQMTVAAVLWDTRGQAGVASKLAQVVEPDDFHDERYRAIYAAAMTLFRAGQAPNFTMITHNLNVSGDMDTVGGEIFMHGLVQSLPMIENFEWWAERVRLTAHRRRLIVALRRTEIAAQRATDDATIEAILADHEARLFEMRSATKLGVPSTMLADVMPLLRQQTADFLADPMRIRGISTGWPELDTVTDGLVRGHLWVAGAPTSLGKSQWSHNLLWNLAKAGEAMTIWCTEMTALAVARRMMHLEAGVDRMAIRRRGSSHLFEETRLTNALEVMEQQGWPVRFITEGRPTTEAIMAEARRDRDLRGCRVQVVDHLGQVVAKGRDMIERTTNVVAGLKSTAMSCDVTVVATSQVNRASQADAPRWARVTDFSNSAGVEQYADIAIGFTPYRFDDGKPVPVSHFEARDLMAKEAILNVNGGAIKVRDGSTDNIPFVLDWEHGGRFVVAS